MVRFIFVLSIAAFLVACSSEKKLSEPSQQIGQESITSERGLASEKLATSDENLKYYFDDKTVPPKNYKGKGRGNDLYEVEVRDEGHPVGKGVDIKIYAICAPDFERQLVTPEYFRVCEYESHSYNKQKDEILLNYSTIPNVSCQAKEIDACEKANGQKCIEKAVDKCADVDPCSVALTTIWPLCPEPVNK